MKIWYVNFFFPFHILQGTFEDELNEQKLGNHSDNLRCVKLKRFTSDLQFENNHKVSQKSES